ncbi:hypothetical protein MANES_08G110550v8 [Manihot esculenta]|uniref:Uncharacterized protein n=1 Tax=Manihot esculenta TaxID=3983 RepID=A0ACB7HC42_MANES|nr:hypothetical protein MANES_08G110550v8 [Manihot esculenta]
MRCIAVKTTFSEETLKNVLQWISFVLRNFPPSKLSFQSHLESLRLKMVQFHQIQALPLEATMPNKFNQHLQSIDISVKINWMVCDDLRSRK